MTTMEAIDVTFDSDEFRQARYVARMTKHPNIRQDHADRLFAEFVAGNPCCISAVGENQESKAMSMVLLLNKRLSKTKVKADDDFPLKAVMVPYRTKKVIHDRETLVGIFILGYYHPKTTKFSAAIDHWIDAAVQGYCKDTCEDFNNGEEDPSTEGAVSAA